MKSYSLALLISISLLASACASMRPIPLNPESLKDQPPAKLFVVQYDAPKFMLLRSKKAFWNMFISAGLGGAVGGAIGGAATYMGAESDGEKLRLAYHLEDPATAIKQNFLENLDSDLAGRPREEAAASTDKMKDLKHRFGESLVLDFKTIVWEYSYYPTSWSHYRFIYMVRSRLLQPSTGKVFWQGICSYQEKDEKQARPTFKDLSTGDGQLVRGEIGTATKECSQKLVAQYKNREAVKPVKPVKTRIAKHHSPAETVPSQPKPAAPLPIPEPEAVPVVKKEVESPPTPAPEKARPTGCLRDEGSLKPLYALERCEVNALAKRCGPGDACMIDCYVSRKGETVEGGCYKICHVWAKGWAIPQEWAACR